MNVYLTSDARQVLPDSEQPIPVSSIKVHGTGPSLLRAGSGVAFKCRATDRDGRQFELTLYPGEIDRIEEDAK